MPTNTSQSTPRLHVARARARQRRDPEAQRRHPAPHPQARPAQLLVSGHHRREGGLAQAGEGLAARRGDLPLPRRQRRRRGHPGHLPASRRAPQRGRLPLQGHGGLPVPRLGVRRVGQERHGAVRGPELRRVRQGGHGGEGLPDAHAQGPRLRVGRRRRPRADRGGRPRGVLRRQRAGPDRPGALAVQLGGRARELDGLARQLRAPERGGRHAQRLHRPRRAGREPDLRRQRLRRRRRREQLHAPERGVRRVRRRPALAEDQLSPPLDVADEAARRSRAAAHPAAALGPVVRRPPPARHVPRRVRLGPLHPHVRAGGGAPDARLVLPLHAAQDRARRASGTGSSTRPSAGGSSSTTSPARTRG